MEKKNVICFGDSNTYGYDPRSWYGGSYDEPWVNLLEKHTGWNIINAGENGREIPRREYELQQAEKICVCDLLIIMLGTNDILQGASPDTTEARMEAFLRRIPLHRDKILLISPPPLQQGTWVTEESLISCSKALAQCYEKLSSRLGIRFLNSGDWNIPLAFDGVHFTEEGHRRFAVNLYRNI